jgi:sugar/nucleoside kinase (ribokinase family)
MLINAAYDVVYVGNYTKDTIVSPAGVKYVDGGAVNYAAHAGARLGLKVAVLTRLAKEDVRVVENLQQVGVDCFVDYTPQSTCVKLEYPTLDVDTRNLYVTSSAGSISISSVEQLNSCAAVIGTTLRGEVSLEVIQALRKKEMLLAADVQGFVRVLRGQSLVFEPWDEMPDVLAYLDILKSDAVEAQFLTGEVDLYSAAQAFAAMGPQEVVLTHKDGVLVYANSQFYNQGFYPQNLVGRSGRGDTCLGAYAAMRLSKTPEEAGIWAAAVTSLKMEALGPFKRSIADIEDLIRRKYRNGCSDRQTAANQPEAN